MYTRREFGFLTLSGLALSPFAALAETVVAGVRLGVQTYSFRDLPRTPNGDAIGCDRQAMTVRPERVRVVVAADRARSRGRPRPAVAGRGADDAGGSPEVAGRDAARSLRAIRKKFNAAGQSIYGYNYSFNPSFTDAEIDRGFEMAKALGAEIITASSTLAAAKRVVPFAEKHRMVVAMHDHSHTEDPNEFATPESFAAAMKISKYFKVNLDIGHFTAANYDPVAYLREHHADITNLHIKDRKKNQHNTPWGQGDTRFGRCCSCSSARAGRFAPTSNTSTAATAGPIDEVKKCLAYAKQALA